MRRAPVVAVAWHDAHAESEGSWTTISSIDDQPYRVVSIGWLIENAKAGHVTLAQSMGCDDSIDSVLHIPVGMIVSQHTVEL
jgi:hypothetical protein